MKCDACGAPVENGKCTYCGKEFQKIIPKGGEDVNHLNQTVNVKVKHEYIDATHKKQKFYQKTWFVLLMLYLFPPAGIILLWVCKKFKRNARIVWSIIGLIWFAIILNNSSSDKEDADSTTISESSEEAVSVWLDGYTEISDFDYYIDGNEIYLKEYNGKDKKVRINSTYQIDGETYNVVAFAEKGFALGNVDSVIIPEGVTSMPKNTFNSCGIKFLYLPSTLAEVESGFWGYFHDVEKIYYGGTEEQWNELCTVDRSEVDVKQIIYDTNPDELK